MKEKDFSKRPEISITYIINTTTKRIPYLYFFVTVRKPNMFLYDLNQNQTKQTEKPSLSQTATEHHTDVAFPKRVHEEPKNSYYRVTGRQQHFYLHCLLLTSQ